MSTPYELTASVRERTGKGAARATRREGKIPGVIYGAGEPAVAVTLDYRAVERRIYGGGFLSTLGMIDLNGDKIRVIARDFQLDPIQDKPMHVDFLRIAQGATLAIDIPVHFVNDEDSPGIKRGGVLNIVRHTVELNCPAESIPEYITCDLTGLDIGDSVHISSIALPEGVTPTVDRDFTVATIAAPAAIKEELRAEAEGEELAEGEEAATEAAEGDEEETKEEGD